MKIIKSIIPDKTIKLCSGDHVDIYVQENEIEFDFFCDGTGNVFSISKKELMEWCNERRDKKQ